MRAHSLIRIGLLWAGIAAHAANAQQYFFTGYTPRNGLVNNRVSTIFQDSKGRMYFGTYGGLSVYDGAHFINYTTGDGLASGLINDIIEMGDDSIWIVSNTRALQCLVHGILKNINTADRFYPVINQLIRCTDGHYYAVSDEGLFRLENDRFVRVPLIDSNGRESGRYLNHAIESHRKLIIVNDPYLDNTVRSATLLVYDLDSKKTTLSTDRTAFYGAIESPVHDILLNTNKGIQKLDTNALSEHRIRLIHYPAGYGPYKYMYFDRNRALWLATAGELMRIDAEGNRQSFAPWSGITGGAINFILQDHENTMWFGSEQNGVLKLVTRGLQFYPRIVPGFIASDLSCHNDSVWLYDQLDHELLLVKKDLTTKLFYGQGKLPHAGRILMGKRAYFVCGNCIYSLQFHGRHFRAILLYRDSIPIEGNIRFDNNGNVVIARTKLTLLIGKTVLQQDLPSLCDQVAVDRYDRFWAVTRSNQLFVFHVDSSGTGPILTTLHRYDKLLSGVSPRSIAVDSMGRIWIGTRDHGLFCLRFDKDGVVFRLQITMLDGLSENFVNFLDCGPDGYIWVCTPTGLDKVCLRQGRLLVENVTPSDEHYTAIAKVVSASGNIYWALARGGCIRIAGANRDSVSYCPQILFCRIETADPPTPNAIGKTLSLPYDHNSLNFFVGAPTFMNEELTRYSYLLEGARDHQWSSPSQRADINLVNLPPGKYSLHVKAEFLTGRYPQTTAIYPFVIRPPWWQTWWFRTGSWLASALLIGLCIYYYVRSKLEIQRTRLEKEQAVEKERTRIATDMHDDLGAGLSRIKFLSETIQLKGQRELPVQDDLGNIGRYAGEMIEKMSEIVWALNEKNDSLGDLLAYTRSYAVNYLTQSGIDCVVATQLASCSSRFVSGEFRRNVYLTVKEALHNIVKHSGARQVQIGIAAGKELSITITDNGIGLNPGKPQVPGNGLGNMCRRIGDIGGRLQIRTCNGTVIELKVPLPA